MPKMTFVGEERWPDWQWREPYEDEADYVNTREVSDETLARWNAVVEAYDAMQAEVEVLLELEKRDQIRTFEYWVERRYTPPESDPKAERFRQWQATGDF